MKIVKKGTNYLRIYWAVVLLLNIRESTYDFLPLRIVEHIQISNLIVSWIFISKLFVHSCLIVYYLFLVFIFVNFIFFFLISFWKKFFNEVFIENLLYQFHNHIHESNFNITHNRCSYFSVNTVVVVVVFVLWIINELLFISAGVLYLNVWM